MEYLFIVVAMERYGRGIHLYSSIAADSTDAKRRVLAMHFENDSTEWHLEAYPVSFGKDPQRMAILPR